MVCEGMRKHRHELEHESGMSGGANGHEHRQACTFFCLPIVMSASSRVCTDIICTATSVMLLNVVDRSRASQNAFSRLKNVEKEACAGRTEYSLPDSSQLNLINHVKLMTLTMFH